MKKKETFGQRFFVTSNYSGYIKRSRIESPGMHIILSETLCSFHLSIVRRRKITRKTTVAVNFHQLYPKKTRHSCKKKLHYVFQALSFCAQRWKENIQHERTLAPGSLSWWRFFSWTYARTNEPISSETTVFLCDRTFRVSGRLNCYRIKCTMGTHELNF